MSDNLQIIRGDSQEITTTFEDENGVAINLTGKTVFFTVRDINCISSSDDTDAIITKKITVHSDPTHGITKITLTKDDTNQEIKSYFYDLQIVSGSDVISTDRGTLEIIQDITKDIT